MRIVLVLAVLGLAACAHEDGACDSDGAALNPHDPVVMEADAALARVKAVFGGAAVAAADEATLAGIACQGSKAQYSRMVHALVAPAWWAYWASSCVADTPPTVTGVSAAIARAAFRVRCPPRFDPDER